MPTPSLSLLNPWFAKQVFLVTDLKSGTGHQVDSWSQALERRLGLRPGAMEQEAHIVHDGIPMLVYHSTQSRVMMGRQIIWVQTGVEPKVAPFGKPGFYDDMRVALSRLINSHDAIFSGFPVDTSGRFLTYTYLSHDFDSRSEVGPELARVSRFVHRTPPGTPIEYGHGMVTKLGGGETPVSRSWDAELENRGSEELIRFVYPDIFLVHSTPHHLYYHDSAQEVVSYYTLLKTLGLVTAITRALVGVQKEEGSRLDDLLGGLARMDSNAFSIARALLHRKSSPPLSWLSDLADSLPALNLEGLEQNWSSVSIASLYPPPFVRGHIRRLEALRAASADERVLRGESVGAESKFVCLCRSESLFPSCQKGIALLNSFAHLSKLLFDKMRYVSSEEDFKNLVVAILGGFEPRAEEHHGGGVPDILVSCGSGIDVVIECKIWRFRNHVLDDLKQVGQYVGDTGPCAFLVYYVPKDKKGPFLPLELVREGIGYDSVCSTSDAIVRIQVPGRPTPVPVAVLFCVAPAGYASRAGARDQSHPRKRAARLLKETSATRGAVG